MKNLLTILVTIFTISLGMAQSETIFSNVRISGFGGPIFSASSLNDEIVLNAGGGGGVIVDNFFIGGFGEGLNLSGTTIKDSRYSLDLGYGGLWLGYSIQGQKAVHPFVGLKLASGEVSLSGLDDNSFEADNIQVVQPEAGLEFNFTSWMRLVAHVGYRNVVGVNNAGVLDDVQLNGMSGGITLRFGFFY
ncbi:MAG: hypothetical protein AAF960_00480 [Bacteroidota bacterium]